ncbi:MAG: DUF1156 domain-containing protein, partial [Chloroflexota bacterium]|nr:DUF1156 domain-containing protein [Chloroflexota bacterium]
ESYKEQMAGAGKTLTALGSYWKGRKPLILAKACVLGCLLPAGEDPQADLAIFETLMAMDDESMVVRLGRRPGVDMILARVRMENFRLYFTVTPDSGLLPSATPFSLSDYGTVRVATRGGRRVALLRPGAESAHPTEIEIAWRDDVSEAERRRWEARAMPKRPYRVMADAAKRAEQVGDEVHAHIWDDVNAHLGTDAHSFPELVEQLGVMRFGHRPRVADTFCGSGQIPFEAARLGCDVYASDLNPVAAMLTWGAFHIVGGSAAERARLAEAQQRLIAAVQAEIDALGVESDGHGWRAKAYLYCVEARCPQTGWMVPLLPTLVISKGRGVIAELQPDPAKRRYDIVLRHGVDAASLKRAEEGTVRSDRRGQDPSMVHTVDGVEYRTKISTLRGDYTLPDGSSANRLRLWEKQDFRPRLDDIFQERLYAVQWMRPKKKGKKYDYEFRPVTEADLERERIVEEYVAMHLAEWQRQGWVPDMRIEPGDKTNEPIRTRGWTYWHHLFNARQLMGLGLMRANITASTEAVPFGGALDFASKLCQWTTSSAGGGKNGAGGRTGGASDNPAHVFYNQALNTFYNYGCRSTSELLDVFRKRIAWSPISGRTCVEGKSAAEIDNKADIFITDPPYGDAVKYEEILEFFIAWLRKNPPPEFASWVWDSRRALAIKGEDEDFRRGMVAAYTRMAECMPDNGIQVIMFTHQSGSIWADMAGIVWASGLQVTAAWYVVTETDSALREGSHVKGTVLLVVRKRQGRERATEDDLAWEIEEEVQQQVESLTGLNQQAKGLYRGENLFQDADLQMAGYAAALRVLTRYAVINGKEMAAEAVRPRQRGETTFVDDLIDFAVGVANAHLVPHGIAKGSWAKLAPAERFYLKLLELEARGLKTLDNYQNFAKAFKVADYQALMGSKKANSARLKSAVELGRSEMGEGSELAGTVLRGVLYAVMELTKEVDADEVLAHLALNSPNYMDQTQRDLVVELADYLAARLATIRPEEAAAARVLRERVRNQRL